MVSLSIWRDLLFINQSIIVWIPWSESTAVRAELVEAWAAGNAPFDKLWVNGDNNLTEYV